MPTVLVIGTLLVSSLFGGGYLLDKVKEAETTTDQTISPWLMAGAAVAACLALYIVYEHFKKK